MVNGGPLPVALRVGVTGHRAFEPGEAEALGAVAGGILGRVAETVRGAAGPREVVLTLLSPLAEGTDQVLAEAALANGYELQCPFPFAVDAYRLDFAPGSDALARFDRLRGLATAVLELDGRRSPPGEGGGAGRAYERVGRVVLDHADVVLAVWDGEDPRGRGGTGQVVEEALSLGIPTIVIPPDRPEAARWLTGRDASDGEPVLENLEARVLRLVEADGPASADAPDEAFRDAAARRAAWRAEPSRVAGWRGRVGRAWASLWPLALRVSARRPATAETKAPPSPPDREGSTSRGRPSALRTHYGGRQASAARLARHYAALYRSSFVANYVLGALAVFLALSTGLVQVRRLIEGAPAEGAGLGALFTVLELLTIGTILAVWRLGRRGRWHEKSVDYRTLAETLRATGSLAMLGTSVPALRPRPYATEERDLGASWIQTEARAARRAAGLLDARFDAPYLDACRGLLSHWVAGQAAYHRDNARRLGHVHHRFERLAFLCALGALVACAIHLIDHDPAVGAWLTWFAAGLPAAAAALHGIDGQAELERISKRSASMAVRLEELRRLPEATRGPRVPESETLARTAREVASALLDEVDDWQVLYRAGDIRPT